MPHICHNVLTETNKVTFGTNHLTPLPTCHICHNILTETNQLTYHGTVLSNDVSPHIVARIKVVRGAFYGLQCAGLCKNGVNASTLRHILNPIRSGLFQTANDPGGGAVKAPPPPYDLENFCVNLYHFIHVHFTRCFRHVPIGIFQNFAILTILQRFKNKN